MTISTLRDIGRGGTLMQLGRRRTYHDARAHFLYAT